MAQPPEQPGRPPAGPGGRRAGFPAVRAAIVLVAFVVVTVLVLGVIHPTTSGTGASPTVTTTTAPTHPTTTTTTVPTAHVPVLVANASGITGAAEAVTNQLKPAGWALLTPVNASAQVTKSNVYYLAGQEQSAKAIATSLQLPASDVVPYTTSAPVSSIGTAEVLVVVGPDLADRTVTGATTSTT